MVCGLLTWLIIAAFHFKKETMSFPVHDRQVFIDRLKAQLEALGYEITLATEDQLTSKPSFQSLLVGSGIQAQINDDSACVVGPKMYLELLRRRLRFESHLDRVQRTFLDAKRREGERLLRRVQISLRVPGETWPEVYRKIIAVLSREDAEVYCDINVLAQSEHGIRDSMIELGVREWLRQQNIKAEIHKELLHTGEPETPRLETAITEAEPPVDKIQEKVEQAS